MVPMEILLTHPYFWKPPKLCDFLKKALPLLRGNKGKPEVQRFIEDLDRDARDDKYILWAHGANWKQVLDDTTTALVENETELTHFTIMTTRYVKKADGPGKWKYLHTPLKKSEKELAEYTISVNSLFDLIRDKHEHGNDIYPEARKEALGWFNEQGHLDDHRFVEYWTSRFPRLVPFLWIKFYQFSQNPHLEKYYPFSLKLYEFELPVDLEDFLGLVKQAISNDLQKGELDARYSFQNEFASRILEFRTLHPDLIQRVLQESSTMEIYISESRVSCKWFDQMGNEKVPTDQKLLASGNFQSFSLTPTLLILGNKIGHIALGSITDNCDRDRSSNVIVFTSGSKDSATDAIESSSMEFVRNEIEKECKVSDMPLKWSELNECFRKDVENEHVLVQGKPVKLLLPGNENVRETILSKIEGNLLISLLRKRIPNIFKSISLPIVTENYMERRLFNRGEVSVNIFNETMDKKDKLVVYNISLERLQALEIDQGNMALVDQGNGMAFKIPDDSNVNIFVLKGEVTDIMKIYNNFRFPGKNVHFLCYLKEDSAFQWMATQGTVAGVEEQFTKCARDLGTMTELELLKCLEKDKSVDKTIFIADTPGMGKSQVLLSLAQKLVKCHSDRFTLFVNMTEFLEGIQIRIEPSSADVKKQNIISAVLSLCCSNLFEECLLENWLLGESESVTCDIMLDGLDEVPIKMRELAVKTLKMFKEEFPSVRTWTTVRDHMLEYIQVKFRSLGYKLEPFTKEDQINFLERHWLGYIQNFPQTAPNISSSELRRFAQKCIQLPLTEQETEIAGIPLQCRMIAEIHESKLLEDNFSSEKDMQVDNKNSLIDLYDQLIERKLQVYLREKSNLLHLKMNHHISNVLRNDLHNSHVYFALKLVFSENNATANEFSTLLFTEKSRMEDISLSVIDQGIIQNLAPLRFNHRTVAEYFVALFVYNVLTGNYLHIHKGDEKFQHFLWNHVLAAHSGMYGREEFKHPAVCQFLNNMWEQFAPPELVSLGIKRLLRVLLLNDNFLQLQSRYTPIYVARQYENMFALFVLESPRTLSLFYLDILGSRMIGYSRAMLVQMVDIWIDVCHTLRKYDENKYGLLHLFVLAIMRVPSAQMGKEMDKVRYILKYAVQKDPSLVEIRDVEGNTPLLLLLRKAEEIKQNNERYLKQDGKYVLNLVKFFITELNSDVNVADNLNNSLLHVREIHGSYSAYNLFQLLLLRLKLLQFFMTNGYKHDTVNFVNDKGETPFVSILNSFGEQWNKKQATGSVFVGVLNAFRKYGANFNERDKNGSTTLLIAIQQGFGLEFVQKIVNGGADIFAVNGRGQCVLHGAIEVRNLDLVKWLVNKNPNWLHARDKRRNTVYQYDVSQEIRQYLEEMKSIGMRPTEIIFHEDGSTYEIIRKRNQ